MAILIAMKFVITFFDYFFGAGAVLIVADLLIFKGGIEEMIDLPYELKIIIGVLMAAYLLARLVWYIVSKRLEYRERVLEILKKEREWLQS